MATKQHMTAMTEALTNAMAPPMPGEDNVSFKIARGIERGLDAIGEHRTWTWQEGETVEAALKETAPYLSDTAIRELSVCALDVIGGMVALKLPLEKKPAVKKRSRAARHADFMNARDAYGRDE